MPLTDYHTAIASRYTPSPALPAVRFEMGQSVALVHDLFSGPLPPEFADCDVLYADLPWRHGFGVFNHRTGTNDGRTYAGFLKAVSDVVDGAQAGTVLVTGVHALPFLPRPTSLQYVRLNGDPALAFFYKMKCVQGAKDATDLLAALARRYARIGDFCCGYGRSARIFWQAGREFTASDYNSTCIGHIASYAPTWHRDDA